MVGNSESWFLTIFDSQLMVCCPKGIKDSPLGHFFFKEGKMVEDMQKVLEYAAKFIEVAEGNSERRVDS